MWQLYRPDALTVWQNEEVRKRLSWYYEVMVNDKPAKYLICKRIQAEVNLKDADEEELWVEHERLFEEFRKIWMKIRSSDLKLTDLRRADVNFLDLKIELANRILEHCHFCERRCGVNRRRERGWCRVTDKSYVASYFHHHGEEAPLVPSGTIFFNGCNFKCAHCQNWDISTNPHNGVEVTPATLAVISEKLRGEGCRNINYVGGDPQPHLHTILESLRYMEVNVPLLWNSNFYMSLEADKLLLSLMDIVLPDLKYFNDQCALRISKVPNYFSVVSRNHKIFHDEGVDMIIRVLILPNHIECCAKPIVKWISENCPNALTNLMSQYRPEHLIVRYPQKYPDLARRPSRKEMEEVYRYADKLGLVWRPVS